MSRIFFYGLFMDVRLLKKKGLHPALIGPAKLPDFRIVIGERATLVPQQGAESFGMLIELPDEEAIALYSATDVCDYRSQDVEAVLLHDLSLIPSRCYNLPPGSLGDSTNTAYAERLSALLLELGFPRAYASEMSSASGA